MSIIETEAILLNKIELRETSLLLDYYTKESGRIKGCIKGVRSPQPQFGSVYEILTLDKIIFYERKNSDIYTVSRCELVDYFPELRKDLKKLGYAAYFAELINTTCGIGEKNEGIFEVLVESLRALCGSGSAKRITRVFEIKLLKALGLVPRLRQCVNCGSEDITRETRVSIKSGGVLCRRCASVDLASIPILAGTLNFIESVAHMPLEKVSRIKLSDPVGKEVERFLKVFLDFHVHTHFKSMEFMKEVGVL